MQYLGAAQQPDEPDEARDGKVARASQVIRVLAGQRTANNRTRIAPGVSRRWATVDRFELTCGNRGITKTEPAAAHSRVVRAGGECGRGGRARRPAARGERRGRSRSQR